MRTQIEAYVNFHGLNVRIDRFLEIWSDYAGRQLKTLPFKRDLRSWNDSPWSLQPKKMIACYQWTRHEGNQCLGVYEIWERKDGMGIEAYRFETIEEYNDYNPSSESPDAIKRELGLCENYEKGI